MVLTACAAHAQTITSVMYQGILFSWHPVQGTNFVA
jgi:hypothetical protein